MTADIAIPPTIPSVPTVTKGHREIRVFRFLFRSTGAAPIWLVVRLWLGWEWLDAGWQKMTGAGADNWLTHPQGLQGFIASANASWAHRALAHGHPAVPYEWIVNLLNDMNGHALLFSRIVTFSELAVGLGRVAGHFGLDYFILPAPGTNRRIRFLRRRASAVDEAPGQNGAPAVAAES